MVRRLVGLLSRVTLACPICAAPDDAQMTAGVRAGALVLIVVTVSVLGPIAGYAIRVWRQERDDR